MKIIILNNPLVKDTMKYFFEILEKFEEFMNLLMTFSLIKNPKIKFYLITDPNSHYSDLFYKPTKSLYDKFLD